MPSPQYHQPPPSTAQMPAAPLSYPPPPFSPISQNIASLAIALTTSVCLFITMTAAVPRPVCFATRSSKSIKTSSQTPLGMRGVELPPGITQSRLSQPPMTSPQCLCISSFRGMLISSSTVQGLFTWPEILKSLEPELRVRPILANQSPPLLQMVGATATVSTLVTVVGQPKTPTSAGNGGFRRGWPCFPSRLSIKAVSSPQM